MQVLNNQCDPVFVFDRSELEAFHRVCNTLRHMKLHESAFPHAADALESLQLVMNGDIESMPYGTPSETIQFV